MGSRSSCKLRGDQIDRRTVDGAESGGLQPSTNGALQQSDWRLELETSKQLRGSIV